MNDNRFSVAVIEGIAWGNWLELCCVCPDPGRWTQRVTGFRVPV